MCSSKFNMSKEVEMKFTHWWQLQKNNNKTNKQQQQNVQQTNAVCLCCGLGPLDPPGDQRRAHTVHRLTPDSSRVAHTLDW